MGLRRRGGDIWGAWSGVRGGARKFLETKAHCGRGVAKAMGVATIKGLEGRGYTGGTLDVGWRYRAEAPYNLS